MERQRQAAPSLRLQRLQKRLKDRASRRTRQSERAREASEVKLSSRDLVDFLRSTALRLTLLAGLEGTQRWVRSGLLTTRHD